MIRSDPMAKNMSNDVVARSALLALLFSFCAGQRHIARQWEVSIAPCILTLHETYSPFHSLLGQKVSRIFLPTRILLKSNLTRSVVEFRATSIWSSTQVSYHLFLSSAQSMTRNCYLVCLRAFPCYNSDDHCAPSFDTLIVTTSTASTAQILV